jgi:hypothetical protein
VVYRTVLYTGTSVVVGGSDSGDVVAIAITGVIVVIVIAVTVVVLAIVGEIFLKHVKGGVTHKDLTRVRIHPPH